MSLTWLMSLLHPKVSNSTHAECLINVFVINIYIEGFIWRWNMRTGSGWSVAMTSYIKYYDMKKIYLFHDWNTRSAIIGKVIYHFKWLSWAICLPGTCIQSIIYVISVYVLTQGSTIILTFNLALKFWGLNQTFSYFLPGSMFFL